MGGALFLVIPPVAGLVGLVVGVQFQNGPAAALAILLTMLVSLRAARWC